MGWSGGTEIFDCVIEDVLWMGNDPDFEDRIIGNLYDTLRNKDWDNVDESEYYDHPRIRAIIKQREPDWFEDDDEAKEEADRRFGQPHYGHD